LQYIHAIEPITESQQPKEQAITEQQSDLAAERQPQQDAAAAAAAAAPKAETEAEQAAAAAGAAGAGASSSARASSSSITMGVKPGRLADSSTWQPRGICREGNQCYGISVLQVWLLQSARQHNRFVSHRCYST
jgi:hypothetical protein